MRGRAVLDILSDKDGRSSFDVLRMKSGLGSVRYLFVRGKLSKETCSGSGDEIIEAEVVLPSVEEA